MRFSNYICQDGQNFDNPATLRFSADTNRTQQNHLIIAGTQVIGTEASTSLLLDSARSDGGHSTVFPTCVAQLVAEF